MAGSYKGRGKRPPKVKHRAMPIAPIASSLKPISVIHVTEQITIYSDLVSADIQSWYDFQKMHVQAACCEPAGCA